MDVKDKCVDDFWDTDLEILEAEFLNEGERIFHLPPCPLTDLVPRQGAILLSRFQYIEAPKTTSLQRVKGYVRNVLER